MKTLAAALPDNQPINELDVRNERVALLSDAAAHLLAAKDPDTMVLELFKKVSSHLNVHAYFNFMVNEVGDALVLDSCAGIPQEVAQSIRRLEFGQAVCGTVALLRKAIYATDIQTSDDAKVQLVKGFGIRAYACNPLMAGDRLLGTLSFASRAKDCFDEGELEFMRTICHYVAIAKERLRMERELRRQNEQLAEAARRKDEFLAMLAHELRNPLAPVRNSAQVLRIIGKGQARLERQTEIIDRQVTHMARLIDDLLDVSRITRGRIVLHPQALVLSDVLTQAMETVMPLMEKQGQNLCVENAAPGLRLQGDRERLVQSIGNLLNNAAKFSPPGAQIHLIAARENQEAVIRVRDEGAGIAPDLLPSIFDLFVQADRSLDRTQGGLGIGLTMARTLVQMHGGTIEAHSDGPARGSEFIVRLPALQEPAPRQIDHGADRHGQAPRRRILVVDDVHDSADTMAELLCLMGHQVKAVYDGPSALETAALIQPDLVLLDIGLPGLNGYEVARRLRQTQDGRPMMIMALTGYGQEPDNQKVREAGFNEHLLKPVDLDRLKAILESEWPDFPVED